MPGERPDAAPSAQGVGRYELLIPIARGGMGTVYLARRRGAFGFEREVALKLTYDNQAGNLDAKAELIEEAKLAARIRHPNVVPVIDVDDDPQGVFLVMEYVEGESLAGLLRESILRGTVLPPAVVLHSLCEALAGLHAAHELRDAAGDLVGLVHRDVSPQNILVGVDGVTRLADFGIARAATRATLTETGAVKGKVAYMPPEQVRGQPLDRRADIWAAGVVAFELLTGRRPYPSEDPTATILRITTDIPPRLREACPELPAELDEAVASALTPNVERRCPTAEELRRRFVAVLRELGPPDPQDVARVVRELAGDKLADRRRRMAEAVAQRTVEPGVDRVGRDDAPDVPTRSASPVANPPVRRSPRRAGWIAIGLLVTTSTWAALRTSPAPTPERPTSLTDLSVPPSVNPAAVAEYRAALQAERDGVADTNFRHLQRAVALDPNLAAAQLRLALLVFTRNTVEGRTRFQRAFESRSSLDPHDLALLEAAEPYVRGEPSNLAEFESRVRAALGRFPLDAELSLWAARLHFLRSRNDPTSDYEDVLAIDPDYGAAYALEAEAQAYAGDAAAALDTADRCVARLPGATQCLLLRSFVEREEGACDRLQSDARRLIAVDPESGHGYRALADAEVALGQPLGSAGEALAHARAALDEGEQAMAPVRDRVALAELSGDFASAERNLAELETSIESSTSRPQHAGVALERVAVLREAGDQAGAADVAEAFLARQNAWVADPRSEDFAIAGDATPFLLAALYRAGRLDEATYSLRRRVWAEQWRARVLPRFLPYVWVAGYAATADAPDEALAALAALDSFGGDVPEFSPRSLVAAQVGHAELLGGRLDAALRDLRRAAASCQAVEFPVAHTRALLDLGGAFERTGDAVQACAAYRRVLDRWGQAIPRSVSAGAALARVRALGCP